MADPRFYRPACLIRLHIRLEDFQAQEGAPPAREDLPFALRLQALRVTEARQEKRLFSGNLRPGKAYNLAEDQLRTTRAEIDALENQSAKAKSTAEGAAGLYSLTMQVTPLTCGVELNSYRMVDTASFTIPFNDVPLESQLIRSCLVEVFGGTVPGGTFGSRVWQLPLDQAHVMFRGYVDDWSVDHSDEGSLITVSARSLECLLVDAKIDPRSPLFKIQGDEKVSSYVNRVLASIPATSSRTGADQLSAIYYVGGSRNSSPEPEPVLNQAMLNRMLQTAKSKAAKAAQLAPTTGTTVLQDGEGADAGTDSGQVLGTGQARMPGEVPSGEMTAWDLITQACGLAGGLVPVYDPALIVPNSGNSSGGDFILLRPPQTIYGTADQGYRIAGGTDDGFERTFANTGKGGGAVTSEIRFMVWGRNIKKLSTSRKLGRVRVPAVEIVSYNPDAPPALRSIVVRYPDKLVADTVNSKGTVPNDATNKVVRKFVRGIRDTTVLKQAAVALYHAIGRNELKVTIETDDMVSHIDPEHPDVGGRNANDILRLRHGTPVRVVVAQQGSTAGTPLTDLFTRRTTGLAEFLLTQSERSNPVLDARARVSLIQEQVRKMETAINNNRRTDLFYVRTIKHSFSADDGWGAVIELVNFLEVRNLPKNISPTDKADDAKRRPRGVPSTAPTARDLARKSRGQ